MKSYTVIGVMSGTSLDGLDIALCEFTYKNKWEFKIHKSETIHYSDLWKKRLSQANILLGIDLLKLDKEFGQFIGTSINSFLIDINQNIDFIASHGHTVFHQPEEGLTLQIGAGAEIASTTNINTISDFRSLDVALGGQGAPLVPIGDELLFSEYDYCLNIGGFANISFKNKDKRIAYDICPANIILNSLAQKLNHEFDKDGMLGQSGKVSQELLIKLNNINYYQNSYPKSLGKEWLDNVFTPILAASNIPISNQITSIYEHVADQISKSFCKNNPSKVLVTGGGAYNQFLINLIKQKTNTQIIIPKPQIIEFKEALIFAFLGLLRSKGEINTLASVTGAKKDSSGGSIYIIK